MNKINKRCLLFGLALIMASGETLVAFEFDRKKAMQLIARHRARETLTPEETIYLNKARAEHQKRRAEAANLPNSAKQNPEDVKDHWGFTPLTEFTPEQTYKGQDGGLYRNYQNTPPDSLLARAMSASKTIEPLDADGNPSTDGKIGLISHGMSNCMQQWATFMEMAEARSTEINPKVVFANAAIGGVTAKDWARPADSRPPNARNPWKTIDKRTAEAGLSPAQVQVAWLLHAQRQPETLGEFPAHTDDLEKDLEAVLKQLREKYTNLKLVFLGSRIYAGYAVANLNPEPYAYEHCFAMRSLILKQADKQTPVVLWGPYTWGDGIVPRKNDGLTWLREDLSKDGTHPGAKGRAKVAQLLWAHFTNDPVCSSWFIVRH